jgi:hypothetical protein
MTKGGGKSRSGSSAHGLALNAAIVVLGAATAILLVSTVLRAAMPEPRGSTPRGAEGRIAPLRPAGAGRAGDEIRVQVLNGCGVGGAGSSVASLLRRAGGIDVVEIGNADNFDYETSVVVDRTGNRASARRVAGALGDPPIILQRGLDQRFDLTVIVGYDHGRWLDPLGRAPSR